MSEQLTLTAAVEIQAGEDTTPRFSIRAYDGGKLEGAKISSGRLSVPVVVDLSTAQFEGEKIKLLKDHDSKRPLGHADSQTIEAEGPNKGVYIAGPFSVPGDDSAGIIQAGKSGFPFEASIGARFKGDEIKAGQTIVVNGERWTGPLIVARNARIYETSIVTLGANRGGTSVHIAATRTGESDMPNELQEQLEAAVAELCSPMVEGRAWPNEKLVAEMRQATLAGEMSVEALAVEMNKQHKLAAKLDDLGSRSGSGGPFVPNSDRTQGAERTLEAALMLKANLSGVAQKVFDERTLEAAHQLSRLSLIDLTRESMRMGGDRPPSDWSELWASAGTSTISLPTALGNAMNKTVEQVFNQTFANYRAFCSVRTAVDFKSNKALRQHLIGDVEPVGKDGEIKHGTLQEQLIEWQTDTFGKMLSFTRQDWANDDMGFLETGPALAMAANRKVNSLVFKALMDNTGSFFSTGRGNLLQGGSSALGPQSLISAIIAMRKMRDNDDNDVDIQPKYLIVGPTNEMMGRSLLQSQEVARDTSVGDSLPTGNPNEARLELLVESRLENDDKYTNADTTQWYVSAGPMDLPVIVGLGPQATPKLERFGFDSVPNKLSVSDRVYIDIGVALAEWRSIIRSDGT